MSKKADIGAWFKLICLSCAKCGLVGVHTWEDLLNLKCRCGGSEFIQRDLENKLAEIGPSREGRYFMLHGASRGAWGGKHGSCQR